jgi:hypothetical protein
MQFESNVRTVLNAAFLILPKCLNHNNPSPTVLTPLVSSELGDATGASYSPLRTRQATKPVIVNLVQV